MEPVKHQHNCTHSYSTAQFVAAAISPVLVDIVLFVVRTADYYVTSNIIHTTSVS